MTYDSLRETCILVQFYNTLHTETVHSGMHLQIHSPFISTHLTIKLKSTFYLSQLSHVN